MWRAVAWLGLTGRGTAWSGMVRALTIRINAIEALGGLALVTAGVWLTFGMGPALIVAGVVIFTFAVFGRKLL